MPARNPRRAFKSHARSKPVGKSRRNLSKYRRASKKVPRTLSANAHPRVYSFNRGFTGSFVLGTADNTNRVYLNTDSKYCVVKLAVEANRLADFTEFNALFSEYKIKSFSTTFTPQFAQNRAQLLLPSTDAVKIGAVPNFEVIAVPARTINASDYDTLTGSQIDNYLNQTQRMNKRVTPGGVLRYSTPNPTVVKSVGPIGKSSTADAYTMGKPVWLSTASGLTPDTLDVSHFGLTLLIRRVDGQAIDTSATKSFGYRITTRVNVDLRKVQ